MKLVDSLVFETFLADDPAWGLEERVIGEKKVEGCRLRPAVPSDGGRWVSSRHPTHATCSLLINGGHRPINLFALKELYTYTQPEQN
jgi:hypothetical protein